MPYMMTDEDKPTVAPGAPTADVVIDVPRGTPSVVQTQDAPPASPDDGYSWIGRTYRQYAGPARAFVQPAANVVAHGLTDWHSPENFSDLTSEPTGPVGKYLASILNPVPETPAGAATMAGIALTGGAGFIPAALGATFGNIAGNILDKPPSFTSM